MSEPRFDDKPLAMLRRVGRETLARRMIDLFLASAPGRVEAINAAHARGDLDGVARAAHSLGPSAGQLGAVALQSVCGQVESAARDAHADAVGSLLPQLGAEHLAAEQWLREILVDQLPPG